MLCRKLGNKVLTQLPSACEHTTPACGGWLSSDSSGVLLSLTLVLLFKIAHPLFGFQCILAYFSHICLFYLKVITVPLAVIETTWEPCAPFTWVPMVTHDSRTLVTPLSLEVSQTTCAYMWEFRSQYPSIVSAAACALQVRCVSDPPLREQVRDLTP